MSIVCPLFSGSEGNSIYIENNGVSFLVDIGRSCKQIEKSIIQNGFNPEKIEYILITHEHVDHIRGLRTFAKKYNSKIYASEGTIKELEKKQILDEKIRYECINLSGTKIGETEINPFEISHDCAQGYGYSILFDDSKVKISVCSDLGIISDNILNSISDSNLVVIESNHDIEMLKKGPYPFFLKKRILSDIGHLSNESCAKLLPKLASNGTKRFILYHLSSNNNTPEIAYESSDFSLKSNGIYNCELYVAPKANLGELRVEI